MLEHINGIPNRIADLKRKLAAREGKAEFKDNVPAIKAEIARLEAATASRKALEEFIAGETVTSEESGAVALADAEDPVQ